jgi:hypothetical protein
MRSLVLATIASLALAMPAVALAQGDAAKSAAQRLIELTAPAERESLAFPFDETLRGNWHYTPRSRDGVAWKSMSSTQREAATDLLRSALSGPGHDKVRALMALESTLRAIETFVLSRDPENYAIAIYGEPGTGGWGWRAGAGASKGIICRCTSASRAIATSRRYRSSSARTPRACRAIRRAGRARAFDCSATKRISRGSGSRACRRPSERPRFSTRALTATS